MASYLSSLFTSKEYSSDEETDSESISSSESSVDEVTDTELSMIQSQHSTVADLDDETVDDESSEEEEENLNLDIQSLNLEETKNEKKILNKYQEFHCYAADKYLKQAKPMLENFRFSFSQMFYLSSLKSTSEINAAKEWMSAYKIQKWWQNRNKKIDIKQNLRSKYPFIAFPF
tara:strand:- start:106 stop:627 length:522 start_codon:yes stop_codon:yes gene_type:complete